jgi:hypothetical protein
MGKHPNLAQGCFIQSWRDQARRRSGVQMLGAM